MGKRFDEWVSLYATWVIRFRWLVILASVVAVIGAAAGAGKLAFSNNYRVFFSPDNPELQAFESFQATYSKNDNILFVLKPASGNVMNASVASAVETVTERAWKIPYAIRVDSLSNFQHTWSAEDDLVVEDLIRDAGRHDKNWYAERERIALEEPLLNGSLIAPDGNATGVNVTLQFPEKNDLVELPAAVSEARAIADEVRAQYPDVTIAISGISMLNNAFAEAGQKDAMTLIPIMYGVLVTMLVFTLRSVSGTLTTLLVIGLATATAMGLAGHLGIRLTPISLTAPTIILTLAIADSIHLLATMLTLMREGVDKISALKESVRVNFMPVSVTSITTIIGFLALNFSDAPPFWDLGNITAMGIAAAWFYSVAFLPAMLSALPVKVRTKRGGAMIPRLMEKLADFVIARRRPVLVVVGAGALALAAAAPSVELNDEFVRYFDHRIEFRNHADFHTKHLSGIYVIEFSVEAGESGGISSPEYLQHLDAFTRFLRTEPDVRHVYSYSDIIRRLNRNMHGDDEAWYRIPGDRNLAAQYLLLYELSLPYGLDLNDRISIDKSATRVTATLNEISTAEIREFLDRATGWLEANTPTAMHARPTGASVMFSWISKRNIESMLRGNLVAIVLIALVLMVSLRSAGLGLVSLLPNAIPILMTFGAWALLVGQVGMAAATVTATSLGIVVDDTVHFLSKYLRARREKGLSRPEA
ncbi:MAG: MMPL family transporter, partial [Pseudomonadota bacterium]